MKKITLLITLIGTSFLMFSQSPGDLIITEIMQNPSAVTDANGEYFEVFNTTSTDININGWIIRDNGSDSHIINDDSGSLIVMANSFLVLGRNGDTLTNGDIDVDYVYSSITLGNADDEIIIETSTGVIINEVLYDGGANFPDPTGASMELTDFSSGNNTGSNWHTSNAMLESGDFGTPGAENSIPVTLSNPEISALKNETILYPNPSTTGEVTLQTSLSSQVEVSIYNSLGAAVTTQTVGNNQAVSTKELAAGTYFVQLTADGNTTKKRIVVQ